MRRAAALLVLSGCASFTTLQRADVLPEGQVRVGVAPIAVQQFRESSADPAMPIVATVRQGLGNGLELGGRFWLIGAGVGLKYQFVKAGPFVASVSPEARGFLIDRRGGSLAYELALPVLGGLAIGDHQLILGARVISRLWSIVNGRDDLALTHFPGVVAAFDFALGRGVHLTPEVNASYWGAGDRWFYDTTIGISFDTDRP